MKIPGLRSRTEEKVFTIVFWIALVVVFLNELPRDGFLLALLGGLLAGALNGAIGVGVTRVIAWARS